MYLNGYRITKWWNVGNSFGLEARHMGLHIPWLGEASYFSKVGVQCTPIGRDVCFYGPYEFIESVHVGKIRLTKARHTQILRQLAYGRYKPGEYDIAFNNCLDFCRDMLELLGLNADIPQPYLDPVPWARWWTSMGTEIKKGCAVFKESVHERRADTVPRYEMLSTVSNRDEEVDLHIEKRLEDYPQNVDTDRTPHESFDQ